MTATYPLVLDVSLKQGQITGARLFGNLSSPPVIEEDVVWTNLVNNACDALREMGEGHAGRIQIRSFQADDQAVVTVSDNGPGIPQDVIEKVFDPFFTTKDIGEGTGLGLSIVSGIVKKHGGEVSVSSSG